MNNQIDQHSTILLVAEHLPFRADLRSLFCVVTGFEIVAEARSMREGIEKALVYRPNIILMDFYLPDGTGLDATRVVLRDLPETKIIFMTTGEIDDDLLIAIQLGAKGYIQKHVPDALLLASLCALNQGVVTRYWKN